MLLSEKELKTIETFSKNKNNEIEFRFGLFSKGEFIPEISPDTFERVNLFLSKFCILEDIEYSVSINDNINSLRKLIICNPPKIGILFADESTMIKQIFMKKETIKKINLKNYNMRVSIAKETLIQPIDTIVESIVTQRKRFVYKWENLIFHSSIRKMRDSDEIRYDIEIELDGYNISNIDFIFNEFLKCLQGTNIIFSIKDKNEILKSYYDLIGTKKFIGIQAQTLTFDRYSFDTKYAVSDKLDGERKILFINNGKIVVISNKKSMWILDNNIKNEFNGIILDCEFFDGTFYVFDILYEFGKDLRKENILNVRIRKYQNIVEKINNLNIKSKEYYFGNTFNTSIERLEYQDSHLTDGIILTPIDKFEAPLKYKFNMPNTIDFKIKKLGATDNFDYEVWTLSCSSPKGEILFKIPEYNITGECYIDMEIAVKYNNNSVVEFEYNKIKRTFIPLRERLDKKEGNNIFVAIDNFYADMHPFQIYWLKNKNITKHDSLFFNYKRIENYLKRNILKKIRNSGNLLVLNGTDHDIYKIIDYNSRNVTMYVEKNEILQKCLKIYEKILNDETTKNFNFNFQIYKEYSGIYDMIVSFDPNLNYTTLFENLSKIASKNCKISLKILDYSFLETYDYQIKSETITIQKHENDTHLIIKSKNCPNEIIKLQKDIFEKIENSEFKIIETVKCLDYYNNWISNDNFLSNNEILYSSIFTYLIITKK